MVVKFLVLGDLHGEMPQILDKDFDAIISPGDICGDDIRKYIKLWIAENTKEKKKTNFDKFCPKWKQKYYEIKSLNKGKKIFKYLSKFNKPIFVVPGNWDHTPHLDGFINNVGNKIENKKNPWSKIVSKFKLVKDIEYKKVNFKGLTLIGHGSVSAPEILEKLKPSELPDRYDYDEAMQRYNYFSKLFQKFRRQFKTVKNPVILLTHNVPYKTKLDKVYAPGTYAHNQHYGSIIARKLIDEFQPMLCIGGHIHENYGKSKLKKTICINAGFGGKVNTIISVDKKKGKVIEINFLGNNKKNN